MQKFKQASLDFFLVALIKVKYMRIVNGFFCIDLSNKIIKTFSNKIRVGCNSIIRKKACSTSGCKSRSKKEQKLSAAFVYCIYPRQLVSQAIFFSSFRSSIARPGHDVAQLKKVCSLETPKESRLYLLILSNSSFVCIAQLLHSSLTWPSHLEKKGERSSEVKKCP